jgi:flagellar basal-body rod modification protein FlgD
MSTTELNALANLAGTAGTQKKDQAKELNDRFLKLLVAQMENQDPLNPLDNAQVTTQMAQINTVTGINELGDSIGKMIEQITGLQTLQAASLTGRDVVVAGNSMQLPAGGTANGAYELPGDASAVKVEVRDSNGALVRTMELGAQRGGVSRFAWDGRTDAGAPAAAGEYRFSVTAGSGKSEYAATALRVGRVEGVRNEGGQLQLLLAGQGAVPYAEVRQILQIEERT